MIVQHRDRQTATVTLDQGEVLNIKHAGKVLSFEKVGGVLTLTIPDDLPAFQIYDEEGDPIV